mgnify:FL=1
MLETIHSREELLKLNKDQDAALCEEIRAFLVENLSHTGGHLASNLGIVETTLAIHKVFDTRVDRLVFDVGHQSYVHKLLTGRMDGFAGLRTYGGMSGFPKPSESEQDAFIAGHASNAVSVALGMARARTLQKKTYNVIALLGDGALTGGLAYEGLNNAGASREPLIVILNDNGMSITPNVGAISRYLSRMRLKPRYFELKLRYRRLMAKLPGGQKIYAFTHKLKAWLRRRLLGKTIFEQMGFTYLGPVEGHDTERIAELLRASAALQEPVLLHLITQKGRGFAPAEKTPQDFHGVGRFDPASGRPMGQNRNTFSGAFGAELTRLAHSDERLCTITAAMRCGTGLDGFARAFPRRFFDVGIAEGHAVCMAAGLAKQGMLPVVAIYSTFLQRSFDMLLHDVAILNLHVVFAVDRAGLVGADGETHHGMFDVGYLREVPGMQIFCPASLAELRRMLQMALYDCKGPVAVRYPTGGEGQYQDCHTSTLIEPGTDCTLVTYGTLYNEALRARELCAEKGVSLELLKLATLTPPDFDAVEASVRRTGRLVVAEEVSDHGCIADELFAALEARGVQARCRKRNLGGGFVTHGARGELLAACALDGQSLYETVMEETAREE